MSPEARGEQLLSATDMRGHGKRRGRVDGPGGVPGSDGGRPSTVTGPTMRMRRRHRVDGAEDVSEAAGEHVFDDRGRAEWRGRHSPR